MVDVPKINEWYNLHETKIELKMLGVQVPAKGRQERLKI